MKSILISKAICLIGEGREITIIYGNKSGNVIYMAANDVNLSDFTFRNIGVSGEVESSSNKSTEAI
jgi:hypothetical protein